jgi:hypothetical protein
VWVTQHNLYRMLNTTYYNGVLSGSRKTFQLMGKLSNLPEFSGILQSSFISSKLWEMANYMA